MKQQAYKLWLEALRSGKYKQAKGALRKGNRFCCLGVLCDIHRKVVEPKTKWKKELRELGDGRYSYNNERGILPDNVLKWAGLTRSEVKLDTLVEMNDSGEGFNKIADVIENKLKPRGKVK